MRRIRPWNWFCFFLGSGMFLSGLAGSVKGITLLLFLTGGPLIVVANMVDVFRRGERLGIEYSPRTRRVVKKVYSVFAPVVLGMIIAVWMDDSESVEVLLYALVLVGGLLWLGYWMLCRELEKGKRD